MVRFAKSFLFLIIYWLLWSPTALTQTASETDDELALGEISGRVLEAQTGAPLADVNIIVLDSYYGAASGRDGSYLIKNIPPGKYTLEVRRIGYDTAVIENVRVKPGRLTVKNVNLASTYIEFEEVVLSATRREQTAQMAPASVSVLKSVDIERRNAKTFDQALETIPGISVYRSTGVSVQSLSIRGSSDVAGGGVGNRVLLAIDGRPALNADSGGAFWSLVPTNFIDRVEIVKGAFSSLYGSTAMGGVINVITKKPSYRSSFKVDVSAGIYELPPKWMRYKDSPSVFSSINLSHSNRLGKVSYLLSLSRNQSQGHRQRSAYEFYNLYGKLFVDLSNNRNLEITLGGDIGRNDYPHPWFSQLAPLKVAAKYTDDVQNKNTFSTDVFYYAVPNPRVKYSSRFYFYRSFFKSEFNPNDPLKSIARNNEDFGTFVQSESKKLGNLTQLDYYLSDQNYLITGLDIQRDLVDSIPDSIMFGKHQVNNFALYAQDEHEFSKKFTLTIGLRYDFNKLVGGNLQTQLSPKLALVYSPLETWSLRFLAGRAFRAPSIAERFFKKEIAAGIPFKPNPDLRAEKMTSLEFGSRFRMNTWAELDLAFFHYNYDNMIYWINISEEEGINGLLFQVRNLNKARIQGVEVTLNVHPVRFWSANFNYTYLDAKDLSEIRENDILAYKIRHALSFVSSLHAGPWFLNLDGRYNSKVEEIFIFDEKDEPDAFLVINAKLQRRLGRTLKLSVGVNNIFNRQYEELARYRMPGRTWIFGSSFEL
jgi:iron complex outermembrane receptor protein